MARNRCPPGVLCVTPELITAIALVGVIIAGIFVYMAQTIKPYQQPQQPQQPQQTYVVQQQPQAQQPNIYVSRGGDDRYSRSPEPLRIWDGPGSGLGFSATKMPFNIPTQGYPPQFASVGILTTDDGQVLPLYSRQATANSDRYNYYTRTDTYNPVPLPLKFGKRECMDDTGCNEIFSKDEVKISATGKSAKATIFKFDAPKYIP